MSHQHDHTGHMHAQADLGDRKVAFAVILNVLLTVAQIIGGILSGSLALIADAIHNLSDALSLIVAYVARRIARRPSDDIMTFGYARAETVAALINYTTLIMVALYLGYEGVMRFFEPTSVDGWLVVIIATIALAIDVATAILMWKLSKDSMNIRAAFLHNVADALSSVAVIAGGTLIILYDWNLVDPVVTILISLYILWHAASEIGGVIRVLMLGAPLFIPTKTACDALQSVDGVRDVHHVHLWMMEEKAVAFQAHLVIDAGRWTDADAIKSAAKKTLTELGVAHITLELECAKHACVDAMRVGHPVNDHG